MLNNLLSALTACALAAILAVPASAQTYYVDAVGGDDSFDGLSEATAWKSLTKVTATTFGAGDSILLKRGSVWEGSFVSPKGSGSVGSPIVLGAYGSGNLPRINAAGLYAASLSFYNQQYWVVEDLEITNSLPGSIATRFGIYVRAQDIGAVRGFILKNLVIHDVSGHPGTKTCGGIYFEVTGLTVPTWFDGFLVEDCSIYDLSPVGVANTSTWATRTLTSSTNWTPSVNVVMRRNRIARTVRNGMIIRVSHRPLIEHNVFEECAKDSSGNALFVFNCDSATIQFNEAFGTRYNPGDEDAGGIDADYRCKSTIIQYNYCHDNEYGGIVVVSDGGGGTTFNDGTVVRYNVLKNNRNHVIRTSGNVTNTTIHNNTIYSAPSAGPVVVVWHKSWGGYADNTRYYNNIFEIQQSGSSFQLGGSTNNVFDYNIFHGIRAAGEPSDPHKITADPQFVAPDSVNSSWASAAGYALRSTSPAINNALTVAAHPSRDYLGEAVPYGPAVDRGAFEFQGEPTSVQRDGAELQGPFLEEAFPNPFNAQTHIRFSLARAQSIKLSVYDTIGNRVRVLLDRTIAAGNHRVSWEGDTDAGVGASSGVYYARLVGETGASTVRVVLLK